MASNYNFAVRKWHEKWVNEGKYFADPNNKEKFFANFPYPYINGFLHLGHLYTSLKVDIITRYYRKKGKNVLFPQAFHATGQPIVAAAQRVKEREPKQIEILKMMGIPESEIPKFENPEYWIEFFSKAAYEDLNLLGYSIDWRRKFFTTELNPAYDKFVRWQYTKLYEKGYIKKGSHAVVYCPKCKHALGDHDRAEGEGVVPEKVTMIKFKLDDLYLIAMTFRPETAYGVTNIWINPNAEYVVYEVNGEKWVVSKDAVPFLEYQDYKGKVLKELKGEELIGKVAENLITNKQVPIFPAEFVDPSKGSGIVMSVPAHAPYDYVALEDLKRNEKLLEKYGIKEQVEKLRLISLIKVPGYGDYPAKEISEKLKIGSQHQKDLLEKATKEIYKLEFHKGVLKDIFGEFAGKSVKDVKDELIEMFKSKGYAFDFYILPEKVVCRCLTPAVVNILKDQWFIAYSNKEWKAKAHAIVDKMHFYPESIRQNFHDAIDWLGDWAFTRERGLGTRFPYDESKLIESLSDSTIYMAYYTIAKYLEHADEYGISIKAIKNSFFDYVFLRIGEKSKVAKENNISEELLEQIRQEFEYWYSPGFDLRVSGKDLIKNHLTMMIFHHAAIFEDRYPLGVGVNGYVMVDGQKMSKSKGNFYTLRQAYEMFGAEETRFAMAYAGDIGLDDPNFETNIVKDIYKKFVGFEKFAMENYAKHEHKPLKEIDLWMLCKLKHLSDHALYAFEGLKTREALQKAFYDLQNALKWYVRRSNELNGKVIDQVIEQQLHLLSIVVPHYAQEVWSKLGKKSDIIDEPFLEFEEHELCHEVMEFESYIEGLLEDVNEIIKLYGKQPSEINIYVASPWKYDVLEYVKETKNVGKVMELVKEQGFFNQDLKDVSGFVTKNFKKLITMPYEALSYEHELEWLVESKSFLEKELKAKVNVLKAQEHEENKKAKLAMPYKPGIEVI